MLWKLIKAPKKEWRERRDDGGGIIYCRYFWWNIFFGGLGARDASDLLIFRVCGWCGVVEDAFLGSRCVFVGQGGVVGGGFYGDYIFWFPWIFLEFPWGFEFL